MLSCYSLLVAFFVYSTNAQNSPVIVSIETDGSKSMHLGPYDRTRFDLVENFHPLQTASVAGAEQMAEFRRAAGVKSVAAGSSGEAGSNQLSIVPQDGEAKLRTPAPQRVVFGDWSEWTSWTACFNGERTRMRTCVSRRAALRIVCHGDSKQFQKCFSSAEHHTAVASDPWTIEREISGDFRA